MSGMNTPTSYQTQLDRGSGGRVKPSPHRPQAWENNSRGVIPLDRGGKHLPRYMQETSISKKKLLFKHNDQNSLRRTRKQQRDAKNNPIDVIDSHRKIAGEIEKLRIQKFDLTRFDQQLDHDLSQIKEELSQLQTIGAAHQEADQEETRAKMAKEFQDYTVEMHRKIEQSTVESESIADMIEKEQQAHETTLNGMMEEHRTFIEEIKFTLDDLDQQIAHTYDANGMYLHANQEKIVHARQAQAQAEHNLSQIDRTGDDLKRALVEEGGWELHLAKIYNLKQHHADAEKYRNIMTLLRMQTEELIGALVEAEAERDMLLEQSRTYTML